MDGLNGVDNEGDYSATVAKLRDKAPYPYTSLTMSPYGRLIAIAGKDTLRIVSIKPSGLKEVKSIRISQVSFIFSDNRRHVGNYPKLMSQIFEVFSSD